MLTGQPPFPGRRRGRDHQPAPARRPGAALAPRPGVPGALDRARAARCSPSAARTGPPAPPRSRELLRRALAEPRRAPPTSRRPRTRSTGSPAASSSAASASSSELRERRRRGAGRHGRPAARWSASRGSARPARPRSSPPTPGARRPGATGAAATRARARPPTGPGSQAIRELRPRRRPGRRWRGRWARGAAEIAQLVPEVRRAARHRAGRPEPSTEEARFRLFDAVASFLVAAARDRPLVLVLDDLHWADEPSLLLLKFAAARDLGDSGLLIVGTYRDVELGRHHPLARVLGELGRRPDRRCAASTPRRSSATSR